MSIEASGIQLLHLNRAPLGEFCEGDFLDQSVRIFDAAGIVHHPAAAKVDPVVGIASAVSDQMHPGEKVLEFDADPRRADSRDATDIELTLRLTLHSCH